MRKQLDLTDPKVREAEALRRVMMVRAELQQTRKFYGVLVGNTKPVITRRVPRAATNGKEHFWNPEYVLGLPNMRQLLGTQVHESEHDGRHHSTRRGGRDPELFNMAADYAINGDVIAQGFELPEDILYREDLVGMSVEQIYRILVAERKAQQQQQQPKPEAGEPESEPEESEQEGDGDDQSDDQSEEAGDDQATDADEAPGDRPDEDEGEGQGQGDGEAEGQGQGDAEADGEAEGEAEGEADGPVSCGNGGIGEVLDAPGDEGEVADQDVKWEVIVKQAAALAKKAGDLPGHWALELEKRKTPTEDWRETLREFFEAGAMVTQTWNRPNKRFAWSGMILPGNQREGINKVVFLLDTSGSMWSYLRNSLVANEVNAAMEAGVISEAVVIQCDTQITDVARFVDGDTVDLQVKGLGGTNMKPGFQWVEENEPDANLIVCLTDLYIPDPGPAPAQDVLWCHYEPMGSSMAEYKHKPTFGRVLDVGSDVTE